jgi:hypothetical protein
MIENGGKRGGNHAMRAYQSFYEMGAVVARTPGAGENMANVRSVEWKKEHNTLAQTWNLQQAQ